MTSRKMVGWADVILVSLVVCMKISWIILQLINHIKALRQNIQDRFDGKLPVINAFEIFNPVKVPERKEAGFKEYGLADIKVLAEYFYTNSEDKEDQT